jgi:hypothetical protein
MLTLAEVILCQLGAVRDLENLRVQLHAFSNVCRVTLFTNDALSDGGITNF